MEIEGRFNGPGSGVASMTRAMYGVFSILR
jgi:hypothetical protein